MSKINPSVILGIIKYYIIKISYSFFLLVVKFTRYHFRLVAGVQKQLIIAMTTTVNKFLFSVVRDYFISS